MSRKPFISPLQLFIVYVNTAIGAGILTLPRFVAEAAKEDMWLSVIVGGLLMLFALWAATQLSRCFPGQTSIEYNRLLLGTTLGQLVNIVQLSLIIGLASLALQTFSFAMKMFLFDLTPQPAFAIGILTVAVYATQYNWGPFLRIQQAAFFFLFTMLIVILLLGLLNMRSEPFLPLLAEGIVPVLKGARPSWFSFSGPELIAGLLLPFFVLPQAAVKTGAASIAFTTFIYTLTVIIAQASLTPAVAAHAILPTITAFRTVEIPDTFIERLDGYLMVLWIFIYFNSLANLLFFASFGASRLLQLEDNRSLVALLAPLLYYLSHLAPTLEDHYTVSSFFNTIGLIWGLGLMPLLLLIAWYKNRRKQAC